MPSDRKFYTLKEKFKKFREQILPKAVVSMS